MNKICEILSGAGGVLNPPASRADLDSAQNRLGVYFPESMRMFYMCCNGLKQPLADAFWNWLPLAELITADVFIASYGSDSGLVADFDELAIKRSIVFCDALFCAPAYAVLIDDRSALNGSVYALNPYFPVAASFDAFIELYADQYKNAFIEGKIV